MQRLKYGGRRSLARPLGALLAAHYPFAADALLVPVPLLLAFFVYLYLQYDSSPAMKMAWEVPRLSQPPLALLILAAAFASGDRMRRHES